MVTLRGEFHVVATKQHVAGRNFRTRRRKRSSRSRRTEIEDDGERRSTWREYHGNVAVWKDDRGSTMWTHDEYLHENVDTKSDTGAMKDCSISKSCGQMVKSWKWRDRCHHESEAKIDNESKVRQQST